MATVGMQHIHRWLNKKGAFVHTYPWQYWIKINLFLLSRSLISACTWVQKLVQEQRPPKGHVCNWSLFVLSAVSDAAKDSSRLGGKEEWKGEVPNLRLRDDWVVKQSILMLFGFVEYDHIQIWLLFPFYTFLFDKKTFPLVLFLFCFHHSLS